MLRLPENAPNFKIKINPFALLQIDPGALHFTFLAKMVGLEPIGP
jgi:hypothetical protein